MFGETNLRLKINVNSLVVAKVVALPDSIKKERKVILLYCLQNGKINFFFIKLTTKLIKYEKPNKKLANGARTKTICFHLSLSLNKFIVLDNEIQVFTFGAF